MHATGTRALLSATLLPRSCSAAVSRLQRGAAIPSPSPRCGSSNDGGSRTGSRRTFHSSAIRAARPEDPNGEQAKDNSTATPGVSGDGGKPLEPPTGHVSGSETAPQTGSTSSSGGNARAAKATSLVEPHIHPESPKVMEPSLGIRSRASRSRNQEALPPVNLPDWFFEDFVSVYDPLRRDSGGSTEVHKEDIRGGKQIEGQGQGHGGGKNIEARLASALAEINRDQLELLRRHFELSHAAARWDEESVAEAIQHLQNGKLKTLEDRLLLSSLAAGCLAALLAFNPDHIDHPSFTELLSSLPEDTKLSLPLILEWHGRGLPLTGEEEFYVRDKLERRLHWSALSDRPEEELWTARELLATVRVGLNAPLPNAKASRDAKRPIPVLAVLNYRGPHAAVSVINDVAEDLEADVVHVDAFSLAQIVGTYLGQTPFSSRGSLFALGYTAAEVNGRLAMRNHSSKAHDDLESLVSVRLRKPLGILLSGKARAETYASQGEDRWEDLKMNRILEELIQAADAKRTTKTASSSHRSLILHVRDYAELNSIPEGASIVAKLRNMVDRMWQKGKKVILVGSSSGDNKLPQWQEAISELSKEEHLLIPFRVMDKKNRDAWSKEDNLRTNLSNLRAALQALTGQATNIDLDGGRSVKLHERMFAFLSENVYDFEWISRFASQLVGRRSQPPLTFEARHLTEVLFLMKQVDHEWRQHDPKLKEPYYSPLAFDSRPDPSAESSGSGESLGGMSSLMNADADLEKKLLSGLVDVKDIKTTFDDVIAPEDIKESLKALTTLSLIRPEAFSYGVLATERIPGCLLYGPPGTGKTLMAKAVAKESGAHMLEVSAASINDMWRGNAEKNVRAVFSIARRMSPMVIFLDEADALLGARSNRPGGGGGGHRLVINQFLREWDGITDAKAFIMVATNRPFDLDDAVLRRLPRKILVDLPTRANRLDILRVMLSGEVLDPSVSLESLARDTELYSGSDLKNVCVAAAMEAVKEEVRARDAHLRDPASAGEYVFPAVRVLTAAHFAAAMGEISASISEDMGTLRAIRRFDERYGDSGRRKKRNSMGFGAFVHSPNTEDARVRTAMPS